MTSGYEVPRVMDTNITVTGVRNYSNDWYVMPIISVQEVQGLNHQKGPIKVQEAISKPLIYNINNQGRTLCFHHKNVK